MSDKSKVIIFIDDETKPVAELLAPVSFELDTRKLTDGPHVLTLVSRDPSGKEGIRKIPFVVRNGPAIAVEGIKENAVIEGVVPIMVNAYGQADQYVFLFDGSVTPLSIPAWAWLLIFGFTGCAMYYLFRLFSLP